MSEKATIELSDKFLENAIKAEEERVKRLDLGRMHDALTKIVKEYAFKNGISFGSKYE